MSHPALGQGCTAIITGAGSGIGLASAVRFAQMGLNVCLADISTSGFGAAYDKVVSAAPGGMDSVMAVPTDVADWADLEALSTKVRNVFGDLHVLMNNAVTRVGGGVFDSDDDWRHAMDVNFWGVVHGVQAFVPDMIRHGQPALVINTGSKQGITNPPGNAAYNVTKAALKFYCESLQHELRNTENCRVSAHLLIPGWTTTAGRDHVEGAWLPDQVVDCLLDGLRSNDFYILCGDDEVSPEMDATRIRWAADDIVENRPPLSRWHPGYANAFKKFSE